MRSDAARPEVVDALYRVDVLRVLANECRGVRPPGEPDLPSLCRLIGTASDAEISLASELRTLDCEHALSEARRMLAEDATLRDHLHDLLAAEVDARRDELVPLLDLVRATLDEGDDR